MNEIQIRVLIERHCRKCSHLNISENYFCCEKGEIFHFSSVLRGFLECLELCDALNLKDKNRHERNSKTISSR